MAMPEGYLQWHAEAEKRTFAGKKQQVCLCHGLWWFWDERKGHKFKKKKNLKKPYFSGRAVR